MSRLTGIAARLSRLPLDTVTEAVARFDVLAKEQAGRVVGNGGVMMMHTSRGRRPSPLSTTSTVSGGADHAVGIVNGEPAALWRWIEDGTKAHGIGRKGRYLSAPGYPHPIRGRISHPGSTGQRAWTKTIAQFRTEYSDLVVTNLKAAMHGR